MQIDKSTSIVFSPTKTTRRIINKIAEGMGYDNSVIDITNSDIRNGAATKFTKDETVIIGAPVYGGTIPKLVKDYLSRLKADNTPAVIVVVYGNREYKNALYDLEQICLDAGFVIAAGGAFIGQHSMSTEKSPIGKGRPDKDDLQMALEFGKTIREKLDKCTSCNSNNKPAIPYDKKFRAMAIPTITPSTNEELCTLCGYCATQCPDNAISIMDDRLITDRRKCIDCYLCIKSCPYGARVMKSVMFKIAAAYMHRECKERKEPEMFLD